MKTEIDFQIDRRVAIAMDAMSAGQRSVLEPMFRDRESFIAHVARPRSSRKLSSSNPYFVTKAGPDLRVVYAKDGETITVMDVVHKVTLDRYLSSEKKQPGQGRDSRPKIGRVGEN